MPSKIKPVKKKTAVKRAEWTQPLGHDAWMEGLWSAARSDHLPHALLVQGAAGIGKFTAMKWFAAGLLCDNGPGAPCMSCGACRRLRANTHPDLLLVDARAAGMDALTVAFFAERKGAPSGGFQGVSVGEFLSLRSAEGGYRVVLVREAERMNLNAQNAFLKTLEEPAPGTVLIMETSMPARLLETIQSRVIVVRAAAPDAQVARAILEQQGVETEELDRLVRMAQGSPGRAMELERNSIPAMRDLLIEWASGQRGAIATRMAVMELKGKFTGKTPAAEARDRARCFLDLGLELWRDTGRLGAGLHPDQLAHGDCLNPLLAYSDTDRSQALQIWMQVRQDVGLNIGAETLLDRALLGSSPAPQSKKR
ncbi:MAG: DNA polymerase III subunit [Planctomycetes bacterium]|nr:DNA polymerase III subunit [Planctomycetota bacterium]